MRFAFGLLDIDHDNYLNGTDLLTVQENLDIYSEYGQEILILIDHYVHTHLLCKDGRINPKHYLHVDNYIMLIRKSGIIEEIKKKILSKPGKHAQKSVFFKNINH